MTRTIVDSDGTIAAAVASLKETGATLSTGAITPDGVSGVITESPDDHPMIPWDFGDDDFKEAPELQTILDTLRQHHEGRFGFLDAMDVTVRALWKKKGGKSGNKAVCGRCVKLAGLARYFGRDEYVIWVAADHGADVRWTNLQLEALLFHELCHIRPVLDENLKSETYGEVIGTALRGHDDELFTDELRVYGAWNHQHQAIADVARTMHLSLPTGNGAGDV